MIDRRVIAFAVLAALAGCAMCPPGVHEPKMSREEAVAIATQAATEAGYDVARFAPPDAQFERAAPDCTWSVSFASREGGLLGALTMLVNDRNGSARVEGRR